MNEAPDVDLDLIMERIRDTIRRRKGAGPETPADQQAASPFAHGQAAIDFAYIHSGHDIQQASLVSHRRVLGRFVMGAKKAARRLLASILERQVAYNAANTRVVTCLKDSVERLDGQAAQLVAQVRAGERARAELLAEVQGLESRLRHELEQARAATVALREDLLRALSEQAGAVQAALREEREARLGPLADQLGAQGRALQALKQSSDAARERVSRAERKLRRILHSSGAGELVDTPSDAGAPDHAGPHLPSAEAGAALDYAGLEERFRGGEDEIKDRQRVYVRYFEGRSDVLDIGCGRGEFLELMRESGVKARGLDVDLDMILLCREKGLDVLHSEAFAHLAALADDSLGGIFAGQVIEHLHPQRVVELVSLCRRKLEPDGVLVLETPNPKCLMVFAETFYKDPSHIQPIHPDTMQFVLESLGFQQVELQFLSPVDPSMRLPSLPADSREVELFNRGVDRLNALLFGFQDYAVIGRKALGASSRDVPAPGS